MTFREAMKQQLIKRGLFESQAEQVLNEYTQELYQDTSNPISLIWSAEAEGYPHNMQKVIWSSVKDYTATWLERNLPEAWSLPLFKYTEEELVQMMNEKQHAN